MSLKQYSPNSIKIWSTDVKAVFVWNNLVRWWLVDYLCFTANAAWSTVQLRTYLSPDSISLETSTDWMTWNSYTVWTTISLVNVWDKVYFRNTSETTVALGKNNNNFHYFQMSGSISASWDVTSLINKNCTTDLVYNYCLYWLFRYCSALTTPPLLPATTLGIACYQEMFVGCSNLTTAPSLPATTLKSYCYQSMFSSCSNLETLPSFPATTLMEYCYYGMFDSCTKIKLSTTKTWDYQTAYRIPTTWTWTTASNALTNMFAYTWWTFKSTPSINTTYYTSNTVV